MSKNASRPKNTIAAGHRHAVGLKSDGTVVAVGDSESGQCEVSGWRDIVAVAAGNVHMATNTGSSHTVGLKSDGTVTAVGWNKHGQCDVSGWRDIVEATDERRQDGRSVLMEPIETNVCDMAVVGDPDENPLLLHRPHDGTHGRRDTSG